MRLRIKQLKYIVLFLILISTLFVSLTTVMAETNNGANNKLILTLDEGMDRALDNSSAIPTMDIQLRGLRRAYDYYSEQRDLAEDLYDELGDYQKVYNRVVELSEQIKSIAPGTEKTSLEAELASKQLILNGYNYLYSPLLYGVPPVAITQDDVYKSYIKPNAAQEFFYQANIKKLELGKETAKNSIAQSVRVMLYDNILNLNETLLFLDKYYDVLSKKYDVLSMKYENGQVSEVDKYKAEVDMQQRQLTQNTTRRTKSNLELNLKQQIGVYPEQEIELKPYRTDERIEQPLFYDDYLNEALSKRAEIANARADLDSKIKMFNIIKEYDDDSSSVDYREAQFEVTEKSAAVTNAINSVTQNIKSGYYDVIKYKQNINIAKQKMINIQNQYKNVLKQHEQGYVDDTVLWDMEIGCLQAQNTYQAALRDYDSALYKLKQASSYGPEYSLKAGMR